MYEELNKLAQLKLNGEIQRRSQEIRECVQEARNKHAARSAANLISGPDEKEIAEIWINGSIGIIRAFAEIWADLIRKKNGHIHTNDLPFLNAAVEGCAKRQSKNLRGVFTTQRTGAHTNYFLELVDVKIGAAVADIRRELAIAGSEYEAFASQYVKDRQMQPTPKIFSVGRRVMVGRGRRIARVTAVDENPSQMGDFRHQVKFEDGQITFVMSADMSPFPTPDEDLPLQNQQTINLHFENTQIANLNLGSQVGTIQNAIHVLTAQDAQSQQLAGLLKEMTEAVVAQKELADPQKQEIIEVLSNVADAATKPPEQRQKGPLKAALSWLPTAIAASSQLVNLWEKLAPIITAHLHLH
jgi:hypothetical protein